MHTPPLNDEQSEFAVQAIGRIRSCFTEKFGIPRQPGLVPAAEAELELFRNYSSEEIIRGLSGVSHIWLVFLFHKTMKDGWQTTVRPPRLGGRRRLGVFATRSPHRPNHIGLSAVRLIGIKNSGAGLVLHLGGVDLLDGTPVLDIKPYLPEVDCLSDAVNEAFSGAAGLKAVTFSSAAATFCERYYQRTGREIRSLIEQVLSQDPRPASQRISKLSFGITLWDVNVRWRLDGEDFLVEHCQLITSEDCYQSR